MSAFRNISGQQAAKRKNKNNSKDFKDKGLQIIIKCNLKIVDYLDLTLNLNDGTYHPFHKTNEETTYIHVESNHPPQIIKKIPRSIEKRLSRLSLTSKDYDEQRLRQCRYNEKLNYTEENNEINKKSRKHNILWFNPLDSKSVKTNIGKLFLRLINKYFPPTHKYSKIFNRNTIKISHICMPNIKSKISTTEHVPLKRKLSSKKHPIYSDNKV